MQMIVLVLALFFFQTALAHEAPENDKPTKEVYKFAKKFGYTNKREVDQALQVC